MSDAIPNIGHVFRDPRLPRIALTHSSYANERGLGRSACNERLEFLGDSVLGHITAEYLYRSYPSKPEGELTKMRSALVCESSLATAARRLNLGEYLRVGRGEDRSGGRERPSILADAFEALLAALYLDGGRDVAERFVRENLLDLAAHYSTQSGDYKTQLQEIVQRDGSPSPEYRIIGERGPEHARTFTAEVLISGVASGSGEGGTKKDAEQSAARAALNSLTAQ
ncbi:MAG: ribonuclease III [Oscillospiraceae bacterium]|jgi:ribonuclease-3|nr:ribonuclease III [Oscillospiraceae bacterium]